MSQILIKFSQPKYHIISYHIVAKTYTGTMSEIDSRKTMSINLNKLGSLDRNASFHLLAPVPSVPHWSAGYSASIFSLAGWKIIFWIPVFLLFKITRSGNQRSPGNLNKLAKWLKSSSFRFSRQRAHLQEFALIRLSSILRSAQWVTVYRLCIQK